MLMPLAAFCCACNSVDANTTRAAMAMAATLEKNKFLIAAIFALHLFDLTAVQRFSQLAIGR